nr:MAG TPA: hypothetical protein [Caudoviricetes sp.]
MRPYFIVRLFFLKVKDTKPTILNLYQTNYLPFLDYILDVYKNYWVSDIESLTQYFCIF